MVSSSIQDQEIKNRAKKLNDEIMAPCCFGGTLNQHADSALTQEMKSRIVLLLKRGLSDEEVIQSMIKHYGPALKMPQSQWQRIRATPESKGFNLLVWFLPFIVLIGGAIIVSIIIRKFVKKDAVQQKNPGSNASGEIYPKLMDRIDAELKNFRS